MIADSPQARAAAVTYLMAVHGELTTDQIRKVTGLTQNGVYYLMDNLSLGRIPFFKPRRGLWTLLQPLPDMYLFDLKNADELGPKLVSEADGND